MIKQIERKLPPGFRELLKEEDAGETEDRNYRLYNVPPMTNDPDKIQTEDDRINYKALCRGQTLLPAKERAKLKCRLSSDEHPYFVLNPLKVEIEHGIPHKLVTYHDVLSADESRELIRLAEPKLNAASVGDKQTVSELRVSRNAWLEDGIPLVDRLSKRINLITGLQTALKWDESGSKRVEEYEQLQIANYGIGGHYGLHQDPMFLYKDHNYQPMLGDQNDYITGDRMTTFMMYLTDVAEGGRTAFPRLGVSVKPEMGSAVMWHNLRKSGWTDMNMLHGGCPVLLGAKWVANKWVREVPNLFRRKCGKTKD